MRYALFLLPLTFSAAQSPAPISKLAVDSSGAIYVAQGSTISKLNQWTATLPCLVLGMSLTRTLVASGAGSIVSIDPNTGAIVSSTSFPVPVGATPQSIAITPAGNIILSGTISSTPPTPGALNIPNEHGFLIKLDPSGKVLWSAAGIGGAITVDSAENVYVAGNGEDAKYPTTANAFQPSASFNICGSGGGLLSSVFPCPQQYVAKVAPDGASLLFSTYLTGHLGSLGVDIALAPDGTIYTVGSAQATDYPVSPGAIIPANPAKFVNTLCSCIIPIIGFASTGFVSRLSADGSQLLYSTYLGGSQFDNVSSIAVAKDGSLVVAGVAGSPDFPGLPQQLDECRPGSTLNNTKTRTFLLRISSDGARIAGAQLLGGTNPGPGIACITDAADTSFADTVSPGQLITINGFGVGPTPSVVADLQNPQTPLGGVSATFDGIPASLTAAGGTIVTAVVPFAIAGKQQTTLTLLHNGVPFDTRQLNVTATTPSTFVLPPNGKTCNTPPPVAFGSFTGASPAPAPLILNADGTINACDNPATSASVVTLFLNGLGAGTPLLTVDLGSGLAFSEIGTQAAAASVSFRLPAIDPAGAAGTNAIYLHVTSDGKIVPDYLVNRGIPLYIR